jgi:hypothetical protein
VVQDARAGFGDLDVEGLGETEGHRLAEFLRTCQLLAYLNAHPLAYLNQASDDDHDAVWRGRLDIYVLLRIGDDVLHLISEREVLRMSERVGPNAQREPNLVFLRDSLHALDGLTLKREHGMVQLHPISILCRPVTRSKLT